MVTFKRLALTDFKIDIPRLAKKKVLTAALEDSGAEIPACTITLRLALAGIVLHGAASLRMSLSATAQPVCSCACTCPCPASVLQHSMRARLCCTSLSSTYKVQCQAMHGATRHLGPGPCVPL